LYIENQPNNALENGGKAMETGCGKEDNNGKTVTGTPLRCGVKLSYGVGKQPKTTVVHLCAKCEKETK
jgi:hypothetical protein